jgi:hypothetical protein
MSDELDELRAIVALLESRLVLVHGEDADLMLVCTVADSMEDDLQPSDAPWLTEDELARVKGERPDSSVLIGRDVIRRTLRYIAGLTKPETPDE